MMRASSGDNMVSFLYKPLCIGVLLFGLFGTIWLRSGIVRLTYDLRGVEEKKMEAVKESKILLAERAKLMSIGNIDLSFRDNAEGGIRPVKGGYVFPDRVRVVHIKRTSAPEPLKASLELQQGK